MMVIPRSEIEPVIENAITVAKSTGKTQWVRAMNWDDIYASIGFTDDQDLNIGTLHATVLPDGTVTRHFKT